MGNGTLQRPAAVPASVWDGMNDEPRAFVMVRVRRMKGVHSRLVASPGRAGYTAEPAPLEGEGAMRTCGAAFRSGRPLTWFDASASNRSSPSRGEGEWMSTRRESTLAEKREGARCAWRTASRGLTGRSPVR